MTDFPDLGTLEKCHLNDSRGVVRVFILEGQLSFDPLNCNLWFRCLFETRCPHSLFRQMGLALSWHSPLPHLMVWAQLPPGWGHWQPLSSPLKQILPSNATLGPPSSDALLQEEQAYFCSFMFGVYFLSCPSTLSDEHKYKLLLFWRDIGRLVGKWAFRMETLAKFCSQQHLASFLG